MCRKESCWAGGQLRRQRIEVRVGGRPSMQAAWQPFLNTPEEATGGGGCGDPILHPHLTPESRQQLLGTQTLRAPMPGAVRRKNHPHPCHHWSHLTFLNVAQCSKHKRGRDVFCPFSCGGGGKEGIYRGCRKDPCGGEEGTQESRPLAQGPGRLPGRQNYQRGPRGAGV